MYQDLANLKLVILNKAKPVSMTSYLSTFMFYSMIEKQSKLNKVECLGYKKIVNGVEGVQKEMITMTPTETELNKNENIDMRGMRNHETLLEERDYIF